MSERLRIVTDQIARTRQYTRLVLDHTDRARWFELAPGCPTHVAWQIGHLAWGQMGHALRTVGGQTTSDPLPQEWGQLFGKGSAASAEASIYPNAVDLVASFDGVFERTMKVLASLPDTVLDEPASHPTGMIHNKLELLYWVAHMRCCTPGRSA